MKLGHGYKLCSQFTITTQVAISTFTFSYIDGFMGDHVVSYSKLATK
jgi:hypothetical protein